MRGLSRVAKSRRIKLRLLACLGVPPDDCATTCQGRIKTSMTTAKESLYESLEVSQRASAAVIKAAYRCLVQMHHPDKHGGHPSAVEKLARINHAYAVLSSPEQRARYDATAGNSTPDTDRRGARASRAAGAASPTAAPKRGGSRAFAFRPLTDPPDGR